jgi:hypothetical protein
MRECCQKRQNLSLDVQQSAQPAAQPIVQSLNPRRRSLARLEL